MATITQQESEILKKVSDTITQFKKAYDENQRNARLKTESTRNINTPRRSKLK